MNYALDALWWRLDDPDVRALAAILTAPALWRTGCELPVRTLLGEEGFRYLLNLNDVGFRLPEPKSPVLGRYAEQLLAFWLANAPHSRLLGRDVVVCDGEGRALGALDYVAELNGEIYHIELTCKYFGGHDGLPESMVGLNPNDTLLNKMNKLPQQLAWSQTPVGGAALANLGVDAAMVRCVSVVRGMAFTDSGVLPCDDVYTVNAWTGRLHTLGQPEHDLEHQRFYPLARHEYLAPARVAEHQLVDYPSCRQKTGLIAVMQPRADGWWHEVERWMWRGESSSIV